MGKRGMGVKTDGEDEMALSKGVYNAYKINNL
jgi:hypothetical protein